MRRVSILFIIFAFLSAYAQKLPVFLSADSIQTGKIIRDVGKDRIPAQFVQKLEFTYAETVVALDSICEQGKCYPTDFETLRVIISVGETAKVPLEGDTIIIVGEKDNLDTISAPIIDPDPAISGDEYILWNIRNQPYCDTFFASDGGILCSFCGKKRVFEWFYAETTSTAVLLHLYRSETYPPEDTCRCSAGKSVLSGIRLAISDGKNRVGSADVIGMINLPEFDEKMVPEYRIPPDEALFEVRFNPDSFIILPGNDTIIEPIAAIDGSWRVRFKNLYPNTRDYETYEGYISYWDDVPWSEIEFSDAGVLNFQMAAPAQYIPTYAGETLGYVDSIIALLEADGIADDSLYLCYPTDGGAVWRWRKIRDIFYKNFNPDQTDCPIVFSRPVDTLFSGIGTLGDNAYKFEFCPPEKACDGEEGMIATGHRYDSRFFADALHFFGTFDLRRLYMRGALKIPPAEIENCSPKLVLYVIGAGCIPRMWLNGTEYVICPEYFPSYGDPYCEEYNGYRVEISSPNINYDGLNEVEIEVISPTIRQIGAQVVFAIKYVPKDTVVFTRFVQKNDVLTINSPIYRGIEVASPGQIEDTAFFPGIDANSAVMVQYKDGMLWHPGEFYLADTMIIIRFADTLADTVPWRWWFYSGREAAE